MYNVIKVFIKGYRTFTESYKGLRAFTGFYKVESIAVVPEPELLYALGFHPPSFRVFPECPPPAGG